MWNYRLVHENNAVRVKEVFYDAEKKSNGYGNAEVVCFDEDEEDPVASIRAQLIRMLAACDKPILNAATDFTRKSE